MRFPKKLTNKLLQRKENQSLRKLGEQNNLVDFSSNDYLGFAKSETIFENTHQFLIKKNIKLNGATGSRLLSGNYSLYNEVETFLARIHQSESALLFNSGYDANLGFFSSIPQRGDIILYDEFSHASIRDGIQLSNAKAYKFQHNNLDDLQRLLKRCQEISNKSDVYVVTESIFSMDGDSPELKETVRICKKHNAFLIVDEAHAIGVFDNGIIQQQNLQNDVFARIITFGKALGCHGAAVLGNKELTQYLVNFARSFIYTTGLSPHSIATILESYLFLNSLDGKAQQTSLQQKINHFKSEIQRLQLNFITSNSTIHCCIIGGNEHTKHVSKELKQNGFDVKPILYPTVQKEKERLRFCLHSYNSEQEITKVLELLTTFV